MATSPIEFRYFLRRITLDDIRAGVQPMRQALGDGVIELYHPPVLQWRVREKGENGVQWGDWSDVPYARDGEP